METMQILPTAAAGTPVRSAKITPVIAQPRLDWQQEHFDVSQFFRETSGPEPCFTTEMGALFDLVTPQIKVRDEFRIIANPVRQKSRQVFGWEHQDAGNQAALKQVHRQLIDGSMTGGDVPGLPLHPHGTPWAV